LGIFSVFPFNIILIFFILIMHVPAMGTGRCLDPEGNGASLGEGGEIGTGPPERGKDRQLKPSDSKNASDRCTVLGKKKKLITIGSRAANQITHVYGAKTVCCRPVTRWQSCMCVKRAHEKGHEGVI
jgi:hypothetical protein